VVAGAAVVEVVAIAVVVEDPTPLDASGGGPSPHRLFLRRLPLLDEALLGSLFILFLRVMLLRLLIIVLPISSISSWLYCLGTIKQF